MRVIKREYYGWKGGKQLKIIPIGDIHLGAAACDEKALDRTIKHIKDNDYYTILMGDYCDFVNRKDPRFDYSQLASWISIGDLGDISSKQVAHFLEKISPIADRVLAVLEGNHETAIKKHSENDVYSKIVMGIKERAGIPDERTLGLGYYGWLRLLFYRSRREKERGQKIDVNLHHGFVGGKLAGAKALNAQRWLWTHDCDLFLLGHSHNTMAQNEAVEGLDKAGNVVLKTRKAAYTGTFLSSINEGGDSTYSEIKGYFPLPMDGVEVTLTPHSEIHQHRVRLTT